MLTLRRLGTVLIGAWAGALCARLLLDWILGLDDVWVGVGIVAGALAGGALSLGDARSLRPLEPDERRDAILGWGTVIGAAAAVACLFVPLPWGVLAAAAVVALTLVVLREVA